MRARAPATCCMSFAVFVAGELLQFVVYRNPALHVAVRGQL
jgi:hypothetical protein